jgi:hypothetical protein
MERTGLDENQDEQEPILGPLQSPLATAAHSALPRLALGGLACGAALLQRSAEGGQQPLKLLGRQAREIQKLPVVGLKPLICGHVFILALFPIKNNSPGEKLSFTMLKE